ncbi:hypothetical protein [Neobacillus mesonae]|nr:hypothetical protein [Neobacillus mesonae]
MDSTSSKNQSTYSLIIDILADFVKEAANKPEKEDEQRKENNEQK